LSLSIPAPGKGWSGIRNPQSGTCNGRRAGMATVTIENFKCMMCGHEYEDKMEKGEDKERSCPKCRSNSIRHLKKKKSPVN
jgi:DNA-directed RNA polymerase subunit RPC12/RpoP